MSEHAADLLSSKAIQRMAQEFAHRLGVIDVSIHDCPQGDGSPYIEVTDAYYFVVEERGVELKRRKTVDPDELLYWILDSVTFSFSSNFEVKHRKLGEDSRRQLFSKQEALLAQLAPHWGRRKAEENQRGPLSV